MMIAWLGNFDNQDTVLNDLHECRLVKIVESLKLECQTTDRSLQRSSRTFQRRATHFSKLFGGAKGFTALSATLRPQWEH